MLSSVMCNLVVMAPPTIPIEERFAASYRVNRRSGCWLWTRSIRQNGYSQFRYSRAKNGYGHVFAYEHFVGPVPDGAVLHHTCRNRHCVNPEHIVAVSPRENVMADDTPARRNAEKTHCKRGHELFGENLRITPTGKRICRACQRLWRDEHRDQLREYQRIYMATRMRDDPVFAAKHREHARKTMAKRRRAKAKP
jgi:hypothetical protein